jgi:oligosaccharide repeat unit polymerase
MGFAFGLMLTVSAIIRLTSPLGALSPSFFLSSSWTFVYGLQTIFASDMISSYIATFTIFAITLSFVVGEVLGCGGLKIKKVNFNISRKNLNDKKNYIRKKNFLKRIVIVFGILSIFGSIQYAHALGLFDANSLDELISLPGIARVAIFSGEINVPFSSRVGFLLAFSGVVLSLSYYFLYSWHWYLSFPLVSVVLMGLSQAGRAGTIIVIMQILTVIYFKHVVNNNGIKIKFMLKLSMILTIIILIVFIGGQLQREGFSSNEVGEALRVLESLRGYLFGGVSAFSTWLVNFNIFTFPTLGRYSFSSLFNFLGLYEQAPGIYNEYSAISEYNETSNIYTAYRSFIDDFTILGACLFYLIAGYLIANKTTRFIAGDRAYISIIIPIFSWLLWSPMASITYFNSFLLSCFIPYIIVKKYWSN